MRGNVIYYISYFLALQVLNTKFGKDWTCSWKDVNRRRQTPTHSNMYLKILRLYVFIQSIHNASLAMILFTYAICIMT